MGSDKLSCMADSSDPNFRSAVLAAELRELRQQANLTSTTVATQLEWNQAKVSRIENAKVLADPEDVRRLLELYGADTPTRAALLELARDAKSKHGWWVSYGDPYAGRYVEMEDAATEINDFETSAIPGLLQTSQYARLVISAYYPDADEQDIEKRVRARMARKPLLDRKNPPTFHAVIDEAAFHRAAAFPDVMIPQVQAIMNTPDNVTIQVLPYSAGFHRALAGAFVVLKFQTFPSKAYVETSGGDLYVESAKDVQRCTVAFEHTSRVALSPQDSAKWMATFLKELRR